MKPSAKKIAFVGFLSIFAILSASAAAYFSSGVLFQGKFMSLQIEPTIAPPTVTIDIPAKDSVKYSYTSEVQFFGHANDSSDNEIKADRLKWSSSIDGNLGSGKSLSTKLTGGRHTIVLSAIDDKGNISTAQKYVNITDLPPEVTINKPSPDSYFSTNEEVRFNGFANDPETHTIPDVALIWKSDLDGILGRGRSMTVQNLSEGVHRITLSATDPANNTGEAAIDIVIAK